MAEAIADAIYRVTLLPSGERFDCPASRPVLDAAHAADILMPYSCRGGRCGSCRGRVIEGEIRYREGLPEALDETSAAAGYALFCSAYARSDLVIELLPPDLGGADIQARA